MRCGFAVDIGTTNIEVSLWNLDSSDANAGCRLSTFKNNHLMESSCDDSVTSETSRAFRAVPLLTKTFRNCLYLYGADVVSRILYAHYNSVEILQQKLISQLKQEFDAMIRESNAVKCGESGFVADSSYVVDRAEPVPESGDFAASGVSGAGCASSRDAYVADRAVFTGNTVMLHFLRGLSVAGFEKAPFTPVSLFGEVVPAASALASLAKEVILPPCISAFLGADIVCASLAVESDLSDSSVSGGAMPATRNAGDASGAMSAAAADTAQETRAAEKPYIIIDIGTNTEIMLVDSDGKRTACSVAAGPAFEGGGLSVDMKGSALVSELARMLDENIMDETGYLGPDDAPSADNAPGELSCNQCATAEFTSKENKRRTQLTQQDVRQLQLAKGATAAAVETLLQSVGLEAADIKKCFICGNFGNALDISAVKKTGLLPVHLADCAVYVGNAALRGAELILLSKTAALSRASEIAQETAVLQLADSAVFAEKYIQNMNFRAKE